MMKFAPGGPFDQEKSPPENIRKAIEAKYHLDKPLYQQYFIYLGGLVTLDLGPSFKVAHLSVNDVIREGIGPTLKLGAFAMLIAVSLGLLVGLIAALNHNSWPDHLVMSSAMLGISIPNMVLAPILLLFLGIKMRLLPVSGLETFSSYILPSFCLSLFFIANIARLTRGSMLEVLSSNYIRTARSKGLPTWRIVVFHCLKPTLIPVVSYLGPATAGMLAGSLVIEKIFVIPGIGRQFVDSAFARDYTMALGMILFYCTLVVFFNALVDISYMFLDPKIRKK
tara:strand:- start:2187 stop:3029 length:843 start_codon:yes stop_codon:yes gene_type:complete